MPAAPIPLLPGDVVTMKSGGPPMTVIRRTPNTPEEVTCYWMVGEGQSVHERSFPDAALNLTTAPVVPAHGPASAPASHK